MESKYAFIDLLRHDLLLALNSSIELLQQYLDNYENWIFIVKVKGN